MSETPTYRRDVRKAPYDLLADLWPKWDNLRHYDSEVLGALELALLRGYQTGYDDGKAHRKPRSMRQEHKRKRAKK